MMGIKIISLEFFPGKGRRQRGVPTNYPVWLSGLLGVLSLDEWDVSVKSAGWLGKYF